MYGTADTAGAANRGAVNVIVRVVYGENRDGLPESAEVEWTDAVDTPDTSQVYAVLAMLTEAATRRRATEIVNHEMAGPDGPDPLGIRDGIRNALAKQPPAQSWGS